MRSAARLAIETFHIYGTQQTLAFHFFSYSRFGQFLCGPEAHHNLTILENNLVGALFGLFQVTRKNRRSLEINRRSQASQMKRLGLKSEQFDERGRE